MNRTFFFRLKEFFCKVYSVLSWYLGYTKKDASSRCIIEIHLEQWNHALHIEGRGHKSDVKWLLDTLKKYHVFPIIYVLKDWIDENNDWKHDFITKSHGIQSHGIHHYYDEKADRSPYFNQEGIPGLCGGFFFRLLPLWIIKKEIRRTGIFYVHPHDFDEEHPQIKNPFINWKRHVGLSSAKKKLEKLLQEVKFE
jgi:hypothetical protein